MLIFEALNSSNTIIEFFKSYGNEDILTKNDGWENYFENINHLIIKPSNSIPTQIKEKIDKKNDIISKKIETESKTIKCNNNLLKIKEIKGGGLLPGWVKLPVRVIGGASPPRTPPQ